MKILFASLFSLACLVSFGQRKQFSWTQSAMNGTPNTVAGWNASGIASEVSVDTLVNIDTTGFWSLWSGGTLLGDNTIGGNHSISFGSLPFDMVNGFNVFSSGALDIRHFIDFSNAFRLGLGPGSAEISASFSSGNNPSIRLLDGTINIGGFNNTVISMGSKTNFIPSPTRPGLNVGSLNSDPTTLVNGDLWYNASTGNLRARVGGSSVNLINGAGVPGRVAYYSGVGTLTSNAGFSFNGISLSAPFVSAPEIQTNVVAAGGAGNLQIGGPANVTTIDGTDLSIENLPDGTPITVLGLDGADKLVSSDDVLINSGTLAPGRVTFVTGIADNVIGGDADFTFDGNQTTTATILRTTAISTPLTGPSDLDITANGSQVTFSTAGNIDATTEGDFSISTAGNIDATTDGDFSINADGTIQVTTSVGLSIVADQNLNLTSNNAAINLDASDINFAEPLSTDNTSTPVAVDGTGKLVQRTDLLAGTVAENQIAFGDANGNLTSSSLLDLNATSPMTIHVGAVDETGLGIEFEGGTPAVIVRNGTGPTQELGMQILTAESNLAEIFAAQTSLRITTSASGGATIEFDFSTGEVSINANNGSIVLDGGTKQSIIFRNIPAADPCATADSGTIWNDTGTLKICP